MRYVFFGTSALAGGLMLAMPALLALALAPSALAQALPVEARVGRLEKEMKAVQRKVFPGGAPIEAQVVKPAAPVVVPGSPASTPVADLMARVAALESQQASITGQVEDNSFKLKQLEAAFNSYKADTEARLLQPEGPPPARPTTAAPVSTPAPVPATDGGTPRPAAARPSIPAAAPASAGASDARKAAVAAIERPDTGDAAADAYAYGFRLWDAKFYPEAQGQLKATVEKFGTTSVASRSQNLLGRAYLDDGKPALASVAFYENYQKRPRGDRAADSLTWLGEALIQLKKPADACKVYGELEQVYGATLSSSLRAMMDKGKTRAKCG